MCITSSLSIQMGILRTNNAQSDLIKIRNQIVDTRIYKLDSK